MTMWIFILVIATIVWAFALGFSVGSSKRWDKHQDEQHEREAIRKIARGER